MHPPFLALPRPGPRSPVVLPRGCEGLAQFRASGWPMALVIPTDCGLLDPACGYWHGVGAANGHSGSPSEIGA